MHMAGFTMAAALAGSAALSLDALPAPVGARAPAAADAAATAALDKTVTAYARDAFAIAEARHFVLAEPLGWQQVVKPIRNKIEAEGGTRIAIPWNRPGYDPIELFRLKDGSGLVIAMEYAKPPAKARVAAYYRVTLHKLPAE